MFEIVEEERRRVDEDGNPGFDPRSSPVVFSDSQVWYLRPPYPQLRPIFKSDPPYRPAASSPWPRSMRPPEPPRTVRVVGHVWSFSVGREEDRLIEAIGACEDGAAKVVATLVLGAMMLRKNYDLTEAEAESLVSSPPEVAPELARSIMAVATGSVPYIPYPAEGE